METKVYIVIRKTKYQGNGKIMNVWYANTDAEIERDRLKKRYPSKCFVVNYFTVN